MRSEIFHAGQVVGNDRLLAPLGIGGQSEVWSAFSAELTVVALKIFIGGHKAFEKAQKEYRISSSLKHSHILSPLSFFECEGYPVIVLPYCEGHSVEGSVGCLGESVLWQLVAQVSDALVCLHGRGFVHLDVKPSNILWNGSIFLLSDFGRCCHLSEIQDEVHLSDESSFKFSAPDLKVGVSEACDIWSLGASIFHLYMGSYVFNGLGGQAQHSNSPLPYMRKSMPQLSETVIRCLAFSPADRPSAAELHQLAVGALEIVVEKPRGRKSLNGRHDSMSEVPKCFWPDEMTEAG